MDKPRFVVDTDEKFKKRVVLKAVREGMTIRDIILDLLNKWLKK